MKKTTLTFIVIASGVFGASKYIETQANGNAEVTLERIKGELSDKQVGDLSYGDISTNVISQQTTIKDLRFQSTGENNNISIEAEKCSLGNKFWDKDADGNLKKVNVVFNNLKMIQKSDFEGGAMPDLFKGMDSATTTYGKISIDFEGLLPNDSEFTQATALTLLGHDQRAKVVVKDMSSSYNNPDLPFFALISPDQLEGLFGMDKYECILDYSSSDHMLKIDVPEYGNAYTTSSVFGHFEINADEAVAAQDLDKITLGEVSLGVQLEALPSLKELKFGDGKDYGTHSLGGINADVRIDGNLGGILTGNGGFPADPLAFMKVIDTLKLKYAFSFTDVNLSFNTHEDEAKRMGEVSLNKLLFDVQKSAGNESDAIGTPLDYLKGGSIKLELLGLKAALPESQAGLLMLMGIPEEVVKNPEVSKLVVDLEGSSNSINLGNSGFESNFGSITPTGKINIETFSLEDVSVTFKDLPPIILMGVTKGLPEEARALIDPTSGESIHTIKITGSIMEGVQYSR